MKITFDISPDSIEEFGRAISKYFVNPSSKNDTSEHVKWMTHSEAAAYIKKTPAALYKLSSEKQVKYSKRGKQNYYRQEDLDVYMEAGLIKTKIEIVSETKLTTKRNYNTLKK